MRVNRFVFPNLPIVEPRRPSRRNGFASVSFICGLRHSASWQQITAASAHAPHSGGKAFCHFLLSQCIPKHTHPGPTGSRRTISDVGHPEFVGPVSLEFAIDEIIGWTHALVTNGRYGASPPTDPSNSGLFHQPFNAFASDMLAADRAELAANSAWMRGAP